MLRIAFFGKVMEMLKANEKSFETNENKYCVIYYWYERKPFCGQIGRGCQKSRHAFLSAALPLLHRPSGFTAEGKAASGALKNRLCGRTKIHRRYFGQLRQIEVVWSFFGMNYLEIAPQAGVLRNPVGQWVTAWEKRIKGEVGSTSEREWAKTLSSWRAWDLQMLDWWLPTHWKSKGSDSCN